jgi:hypothetical protein
MSPGESNKQVKQQALLMHCFDKAAADVTKSTTAGAITNG